ncbi:hypothetical protein AKJ09_09344 [Labilithrix luteola]|uniref:Uncharacterized protein n=1 Tax=Labilithrix luteola TaxID=1391654 RepID=A0A0K1QA62_9BACT|nr:hypothetical protein AKJ09_09344 [Labilithrix luteola]
MIERFREPEILVIDTSREASPGSLRDLCVRRGVAALAPVTCSRHERWN